MIISKWLLHLKSAIWQMHCARWQISEAWNLVHSMHIATYLLSIYLLPLFILHNIIIICSFEEITFGLNAHYLLWWCSARPVLLLWKSKEPLWNMDMIWDIPPPLGLLKPTVEHITSCKEDAYSWRKKSYLKDKSSNTCEADQEVRWGFVTNHWLRRLFEQKPRCCTATCKLAIYKTG